MIVFAWLTQRPEFQVIAKFATHSYPPRIPTGGTRDYLPVPGRPRLLEGAAVANKRKDNFYCKCI